MQIDRDVLQQVLLSDSVELDEVAQVIVSVFDCTFFGGVPELFEHCVTLFSGRKFFHDEPELQRRHLQRNGTARSTGFEHVTEEGADDLAQLIENKSRSICTDLAALRK